MKSQNVNFADGVFVIVCPHCSTELSLDEQQLGQINDQMGGKFACQVGSCAQEIEFPSTEEAAAIKAAATTVPSPEPQPAPSPSGAAPAPPPQANPAAKPTPPPQANPAAEPTSPSPETPKQELPEGEPPASPAKAEEGINPSEMPTPPPQVNPAADSTPPSEAPQQEASTSEPPAPPVKAEDEIVVGFGGGSTVTLEREAAGLHRLSVKTILHSDCVYDKKDTFDDVVSKFLSSLEEENLVDVHPVQYTADEKKGADFGVMILYKTVPKED